MWMKFDLFFCFFFSSRRRHTRFDCDWSSDVCSSDLTLERGVDLRGLAALAVEHGDLEVFAERLDRVGGILRAPAALARTVLRHSRADELLEPGAPLQEDGFERLHDPMIERARPLHSVLTSSPRYSLGSKAPISESSGWNSSVGEARSPPPSSAAIIAAMAIHLSPPWSERGARASTVSEWSRASIVSRARCWARETRRRSSRVSWFLLPSPRA